ncbi:MAG: hypothetical protein H5U40_15125 [Polyangiaceae bacterium]|nr:hypothetical protein [Polyangiaceae bacterium]
MTTLPLVASVPVAGGIGRSVTLSIPEGAVSFGFYLFGNTVGTRVAFGGLFAPDGTNVLDESSSPLAAEDDIQFCTAGFCSLVVPKETRVLPVSGTWTAAVVAFDAEDLEGVSARGVIREGPLGASPTFTLRPFVVTDAVPAAQLASSLDAVADLFDAMYGITLSIEPIVALESPSGESVVQDFLQPDTAAVVSMGDPESINLFFARRILGVGGLLGIASGIPASHGVAGPFNGLLIHLENHTTGSGSLVSALLEETIAHEMGHMLGLFHTTESDAAFFDPISDTPECSIENDLDMDGLLLVDECLELGGDNLMFWTPGTTTGAAVVQRTLTADQRFVISRSLVGQ